jgi:hypothetical protein
MSVKTKIIFAFFDDNAAPMLIFNFREHACSNNFVSHRGKYVSAIMPALAGCSVQYGGGERFFLNRGGSSPPLPLNTQNRLQPWRE